MSKLNVQIGAVVREGRVGASISRRLRRIPSPLDLVREVRSRWLRTRTLSGVLRGRDSAALISVRSYSVSAQADVMMASFGRALAGQSKLTPTIRDIKGMSGQKYRSFINNLVESYDGSVRYLEVGSWAGSTATAALFGNKVKALCIDNWSQFGGPRTEFFTNLEKVKSPDVDFAFIEKDFRSVDFSSVGLFNVYLFDGPHSEQDHYDGIVLAQHALNDRYILIVDDWNWRSVRNGTLRALSKIGVRIEAAIEVRTTLNNTHPTKHGKESDWHNGYFIAALQKEHV
jgi:hypothetical protein